MDDPLLAGITTGWVAAADHDGELWIDRYGPDTEPVPEPEYPALSVPALVTAGTQDYDDAFGNLFTRYDLTVTNWADYAAELFETDAALEPCGPDENGSRTWVHIVDADADERTYGFCALRRRWISPGSGSPCHAARLRPRACTWRFGTASTMNT